MHRFIAYAVPLLLLQLALFGFAVELLDVEPRRGSVIRLALLEQPRVPGHLVLGTWLIEASGLIALFLLAQGRLGRWWLDGLVAGSVAWIFRGPLLVITIVVAARQPQDAWWTLAFGWWVLYSVCGLSLAILARRSGLEPWAQASAEVPADSVESEPLGGPEEDTAVEHQAPVVAMESISVDSKANSAVEEADQGEATVVEPAVREATGEDGEVEREEPEVSPESISVESEPDPLVANKA